MRLTTFIVNPAAGRGRALGAWRSLEADALRTCAPAEVAWSAARGDTIRLARTAADGGARVVVAVGGDGTINEVVNGIMGRAAGSSPPVLGILGVGTGRDLARTLGLPADLRAQLARLANGDDHPIDIGRVRHEDSGGSPVRYYANVASFGLSGVTDRIMDGHGAGWLSAKLAFQLAVFRAMMIYRNAPVRLRVDDGPWQRVTVKLAALCNGRHFGGGMRIAPHALLDDGLLDCIVIGDVTVPTLVRKLGTVYRGEHLQLPDVAWSRGRVVVAEPVDPAVKVPLDIDGEALGFLPATFDVLPGALTVRY